jgi:hypothetical protein
MYIYYDIDSTDMEWFFRTYPAHRRIRVIGYETYKFLRFVFLTQDYQINLI